MTRVELKSEEDEGCANPLVGSTGRLGGTVVEGSEVGSGSKVIGGSKVASGSEVKGGSVGGAVVAG